MTEEVKEIELTCSIDIGGEKIDRLKMREPKVSDQLASSEFKGSDAARELFLLGNLCTVEPKVLEQLTLRDYKKVQNVFLDFVS